MAEQWQMRTCYTSQTATVSKYLKEGFEPFWGYRVSRNDIAKGEKQKPDVKMYFRKAPEIVLIKELSESEPMKFDLEPLIGFTNQFRSVLSGLLDEFTERFFQRLAQLQIGDPDLGLVGSKKNREPLSKIADELESRGDFPGTPENPEDIELDVIEDNPLGDREAPAGDTFRPLAEGEDIPVISTVIRTPQQDSTIQSLKSQYGNISILPGNEVGAIRVMVGATLYRIGPGGNFTTEETGAKTSSL